MEAYILKVCCLYYYDDCNATTQGVLITKQGEWRQISVRSNNSLR
jgi:hypothetical protein